MSQIPTKIHVLTLRKLTDLIYQRSESINALVTQLVCKYAIIHLLPFVTRTVSFEENAECSCSKGEVDGSCYPPGVTEGPECSGRGTCVCGQCVCNPQPDPQYPTKVKSFFFK